MDKQTNPRRWKWESTGAVCCFGGGMVAALTGSILTATTWFMGAALHPWLHGAGTALLITTIPLLILSGYCLDWAEQTPTQKRSAEFHDAGQH